MKTNQTTKPNATKDKLNKLMAERNKLIKWLNYDVNELAQCGDFECINYEIIQTISEIATYKTLNFLISNNATNSTDTENNANGTTTTHGYNLATNLLKTLYQDVKLMHNNIATEIFTDSADLIQESNKALTPYFNNNVIFSLEDTIYTKVLKNGNEKNYNAFSLACKSIRDYITKQDKRQFKKQFYLIGYTDNGTEILTTKKPLNDISDTTKKQRKNFVMSYHLTPLEQEIILSIFDNCDYKATMQKLNISKDMFYRTLKSAKEKILKVDKRIRL